MTLAHQLRDLPFANLIPDLTDDATAGILWVMAGRPDVEWSPAAGIVRIFPRHGTAGGKGSVEGPTLGEACAALMVARGSGRNEG